MGDETSEVEKEIQTLKISKEVEEYKLVTSLDELPRNVIVTILSMLDLDDFGAIFFVNKKLNQIAKDDYLWQAIYQTTNWTIPLSMNDNVIFTEFLNQKPKEEIALLVKNEDSDIIGQDTLNFVDPENVWYSFFTLRFTVELEMGASTEVYEVEEIEEIEEERDEEVYEEDDDDYQGSHEEYYSGSENDSENDQQVSQLEKHLEGASQDLENVQIFDLISERFPEFSFHFSRMDQFLISFFSNHKIITDLINLLLQKNSYAPEKINQSQKIENFILQILANENICAIYIEDEKYNLLNHLFSHLEKDKQFEKNDKFFSFFVIIVENIFKYFPSEFINFMQTNNTILPNLINNVSENPKFSELLIKFTENSLSHPWLLSSNFFPSLLQYLTGLNDPDEEEETCDVIMEILHGCLAWPESDLITDLFNNPVVADSLISFILSSSSPSGTFPLTREDRIVNGIKIYLGMSSLISDFIVDMPHLIQQMLLPSTLQFLTDVLNKDKTSFFGHTRLSVIELFSGLLITGYSTVFEIFKNEKIFDLLFNLFFEYPWNNILHHHLLQVFCCLTFAGNNDENFVSSVLETSGLIDKIVDAFAKETPHTVGYLSYLQRISNDLIDHAQHSTPLCTLLENNERWLEFMNSLETLNSLEVQQSQQEDTYEGEYDEDLDGYEGEEVCQVEEYQVIEEEENENEDNEEH